MHKRQVDRFRESRERRDKALGELERLLLEELWDTPSQVLDRPSRVLSPVRVESEAPPSRSGGLPKQTKQVITTVAVALATAIVSALANMGATKTHEPPKTTQPGP